MQRTSTKTLFSYWNQLRGSRSAPERKNVDPTKIRNALSNTFILEADEKNHFSFRLAGSHLCSTYCRELKGRNFEHLWSDKDRDAIKTLIKAVTNDHAVALVTFEGTSQSSNKMNFETILLPLRHNGSSTNRILGAMSADDEPYWFGAQPIIDQRITGLRLIWPDDVSMDTSFLDVSTHIDQDVQFEEDSQLFATPAKVHGVNARRYAHLAVIDGGRN
ncbi:MAG: PAS domain-containing protein [Devosiaceae bacterium]|nr:PAS domain-containing protein [Devosiaceae bacterium]